LSGNAAAELLVGFEGRLVGVITNDVATGLMRFRYAPDWLTQSDGFPISSSLPLSAETYAEAGHGFFANLLPEGMVRHRLTQQLGISEDNDFALLQAIGGECAGALVVGTADQIAEESSPPDYEPVTLPALAMLARERGALPTLAGKRGLRLSLAGAQDKVPVYVESGRYFLPRGKAASTHILKFNRRDFKHLPDNEVLVSLFAHVLEIPHARTSLLREGRQTLCLVERYDRIRQAGGRVRRLHQEDLCQALGIGPRRKYESEGGPSFLECYELVRRQSISPLADAAALLRWLVMNLLACNADAHAKNVSLLLQPQVRLAPFYDLVCTRAYRSLDRGLAMTIDGESDAGKIGRRHWLALAERLDVKAGFVLDVVAQLCEVAPTAAQAAAKHFVGLYGNSPAIGMVLPAIHKQARRTTQLLRQG